MYVKFIRVNSKTHIPSLIEVDGIEYRNPTKNDINNEMFYTLTSDDGKSIIVSHKDVISFEKKRKNEWEKRSTQKAGKTNKTYKLPTDVVEAFASACLNANRAQSDVLIELMNNFINKNNGKV